MWYIAVIVLTEPEKMGRKRYSCESCNVLIEATSAIHAYEKSTAWGIDAASKHVYGYSLFGIQGLWQIGGVIGDGVDISGRFYEKLEVWKRKDELIPDRDSLSAIRIEGSMDEKLGDIITPYQQRILTRGLAHKPEDAEEND